MEQFQYKELLSSAKMNKLVDELNRKASADLDNISEQGVERIHEVSTKELDVTDLVVHANKWMSISIEDLYEHKLFYRRRVSFDEEKEIKLPVIVCETSYRAREFGTALIYFDMYSNEESDEDGVNFVLLQRRYVDGQHQIAQLRTKYYPMCNVKELLKTTLRTREIKYKRHGSMYSSLSSLKLKDSGFHLFHITDPSKYSDLSYSNLKDGVGTLRSEIKTFGEGISVFTKKWIQTCNDVIFKSEKTFLVKTDAIVLDADKMCVNTPVFKTNTHTHKEQIDFEKNTQAKDIRLYSNGVTEIINTGGQNIVRIANNDIENEKQTKVYLGKHRAIIGVQKDVSDKGINHPHSWIDTGLIIDKSKVRIVEDGEEKEIGGGSSFPLLTSTRLIETDGSFILLNPTSFVCSSYGNDSDDLSFLVNPGYIQVKNNSAMTYARMSNNGILTLSNNWSNLLYSTCELSSNRFKMTIANDPKIVEVNVLSTPCIQLRQSTDNGKTYDSVEMRMDGIYKNNVKIIPFD